MQASPCLLCCEAFHYGHIRSYSSPLSRSLGDLFFTDFWYLFKEKCLKFSHIRYFQKVYRQNPQRRVSREKDKIYNSGLFLIFSLKISLKNVIKNQTKWHFRLEELLLSMVWLQAKPNRYTKILHFHMRSSKPVCLAKQSISCLKHVPP